MYWRTEILLFLLLTLPNVGLTSLGTYMTKCSYRSNDCRASQRVWIRILDWSTRADSLNVRKQNFRVSARDNTGQNKEEGHTLRPRIEIKIHDPAGNRTWAARLDCRNSTDHVKTTNDWVLNSCPTQNRVVGRDTVKPLYRRSVKSKDTGRLRLLHHKRGWWHKINEMNGMSVKKWWN